jgi:integrase
MARGSITPRPTKDGKIRYRIKWESRGPDGERKHHSATRANKKAAEIFLSEKLGEVNDGSFVVATRDTVEAFLNRWIAASASGWAEATAYQYSSAIKNRIVPQIGALKLARLDELTIQDLYAKLTDSGYSGRTVLATHTILTSALAQAVDWRILPRNPAAGAKPPRVDDNAPDAWSHAEADEFLDATAGDRFAPLWRLGIDSGMRLGEILSVAWRDFHRERGVIAVRRTLTRTGKGGWKIGDLPKTTTSRRSIDLSPTTVAALRAHGARQAERRLACGGSWEDLGLIFDRGDGHWLDPTTVRREFERAVRATGLPRITPHGMRHTMATLLLEAGIHPKVVQERLGHKSIQMTLDRYSHVSMSMQQQAATTIERMLPGKARPNRGQDAV